MDPEDQIEDTGAAVVADADQTSSQDVTEEGSASSAEAVETRTTAEIIREEFAKKYGGEEEPAQAEPEPKPEPAARESADEDPKAPRIPDDVFKALPPVARERIGYLSDQLRRHKADVAEATRQVEDARPARDAFEKLHAWTEKNNLSSEDVSQGLAIMAHLQMGRMKEFLEAVTPFVEMARQSVGEAISPEVQALVDSGEITEAAAKRLTQTDRARLMAEQAAARSQNAAKALTEAQAARDEEAERQRFVAAIQNQARTTETALSASDADYALKAPAIKEMFQDAIRDGWRPKTAEDVDAKIRAIHGRITALVPKPVQRATAPIPGASEPQRKMPAARSTLEGLQRAFAG